MAETFDQKQPYEAYYVEFDFTALLGPTETLSTATVSAVDQETDEDVTSSVTDVLRQTITTPKVFVWVRDGVSEHTYFIRCQIVGSLGSHYELDGILPVLLDAPDNIPSTADELADFISLATYKSIVSTSSVQYDTVLSMIIAAVSAKIKSLCGWDFVLSLRTQYLDSSPGIDAILLDYHPVVQDYLHSFSLYYDSSRVFDATTLVDSTRYVLNKEDGIIKLNTILSRGSSNNVIKVVYYAGYPVISAVDPQLTNVIEVPADLRMFVAYKVAEIFKEITKLGFSEAITSLKKIDNYDVSNHFLAGNEVLGKYRAGSWF